MFADGARDSTQDMLGRVVDSRYKILESMASGSMGTVFKAERVPANQYPGARFADAASWLVDQERFAAFSADGAHHESRTT